MVSISGLCKKYPGNEEPTLQDVSLTLPDTGLFFLVGKSGSGKSTLLAILGAMDFDYEGRVEVDGIDLKGLSETERADFRFRNIGFAFQDGKAREEESIYENLSKPLAIGNMTAIERREKILRRLEEIGLKDRSASRFRDLSGGEKKRISLVRALLCETPIMLLDEPMASLDPPMRKAILSLLEKEARGRLILVITHEKDEIPGSAGLFCLQDGKIATLRTPTSQGRADKKGFERRPFVGLPFLSSLLSSFWAKRRFLFVAIASLVVSLFSIIFSFLLSGGVKDALSATLTSFMKENALVVDLKEDTIGSTNYELVGYNDLLRIKREFPSFVLDVSPFYVTSLNDIFLNDQRISLSYRGRHVVLPEISLDSFLQFQTVEEAKMEKDIAVDTREIGYEEVILALDEESLTALYMMLFFEEPPYGMTEETLDDIRRRIWYEGLTLEIQASHGAWSYNLRHSYLVVDILQDESCYLLSPHSDFGEYFVSSVMQFQEVSEGEKNDSMPPWTLEKCYGLRLIPGKSGNFLSVFLKAEDFDDCTLCVLREKPYYVDSDAKTHNRIKVYRDYLSRISVSEVKAFAAANEGLVKSLCFSSPVYTYTASGFLSGFQKPFFFSKNKEKLNAVMDQASLSEENLGAFQGASIAVEKGVIKADLLSAMEQDGLRFFSLDNAGKRPRHGKAPTGIGEIALSSHLAERLFGNPSACLGESLHCLMLDRIVPHGDGYRNIFSEGSLIISGIYESEENAIFQDSLFPLCYAFQHASLTPDELRIDQAVIEVDLEKQDSLYYEKEIARFGNYKGSFPMLSMTEEIGETLEFLSRLFLGFALFSLLTAAFLLSLALHLILSKDRKGIAILLSLGYRRSEILSFYGTMGLSVGLVSLLVAYGLAWIAEGTIQTVLSGMLSHYGRDSFPYLVGLFVVLSVTLILSFALSFSIRKVSPKDAFLR